jgi:hypothetical protein
VHVPREAEDALHAVLRLIQKRFLKPNTQLSADISVLLPIRRSDLPPDYSC